MEVKIDRHLLGIQEFKYYSSWNSDKWIQWVRNRYIEDSEGRRGSESVSPKPPLYGQWVNIIIIASEEDIHSAFSAASNHSYTDENKTEYLWSDIPFLVFVVVRKANKNGGSSDSQDDGNSRFNVFNCSNKKMFINAKVDLSSGTASVLSIQHLFPKKVKNPKETLRIPLVACKKVGQVRGLLDEIMFQLKN